MKQWGPLILLVFAVTLAYMIGVRLTESAMAVVIGVVFGVAASIPTSLILVFALRRQGDTRTHYGEATPQQPPTIIVTPQIPPPAAGSQMPGYGWPHMAQYLPPMYDSAEGDAPHTRRYRVVGDE